MVSLRVEQSLVLLLAEAEVQSMDNADDALDSPKRLAAEEGCGHPFLL